MPNCHELTPEEHKELHQALLKLLLEFDRVSALAGTPYQLGAGTLLGAVRHKGFIPWDDDIDVCMLRSDYERFLKVAGCYLAPEFFLQHQKVEPKYPHLFAKLRLNGTEFVTPEYQTLGIHQGIYIDIFPFDEVRPQQIMGKIHFILLNHFVRASRALIASRSYALGVNRSPMMRKVIQCCYRLLQWIGQQRLDRLTVWLATYYLREPRLLNMGAPEYVACMVSGAATYAKQIQRTRTFAAFTQTMCAEFSGHQFPIPCNYDQVLTNLYGKYRELPPIEHRRPIHRIVRFRAK